MTVRVRFRQDHLGFFQVGNFGIDHERVTGIGRCHDYLHQAQIFGTHRLYLWGKHPELFSCNGMIT